MANSIVPLSFHEIENVTGGDLIDIASSILGGIGGFLLSELIIIAIANNPQYCTTTLKKNIFGFERQHTPTFLPALSLKKLIEELPSVFVLMQTLTATGAVVTHSIVNTIYNWK